MPDFKYIGDGGETFYPPGAPAVAPKHGDVHSFKNNPGARWEPVTKPAKPARKKPAKKTPAAAGDTKE